MADAVNDFGAIELPAAEDFGAIELPAVEPEAAPEPTLEELEAQAEARKTFEAKKTPIERYGPPVAAGLQAFAKTTLPVIAGGIEQFFGVTPEQQLALREENPIATALGTVGGIGVQIAATGGLGGAAQLAGREAAAAAAAQGATVAQQAAAAAKAAAAVGPGVAGTLAAPLTLATRAGAAARAGTAAALGKGVAGKVAAGTAGALAEGAVISAALEADESRLPGHKFSGEAVAHGALMSGGFGGVLAGVPASISAVGRTEVGRRLTKSLGDTAAVRVMKKFGATASEIDRAKKQIGETRYFSVLNDAERLGLVRPTMSVERSGELAEALLNESGSTIGAFADEAAVRAAQSPALAPRTSDIVERISKELIEPLAASPGVEQQAIAKSLAGRISLFQRLNPDRVSAKDLHDFRTQISKTIYGLRSTRDPLRSPEIAALRDMRGVLTEQVGEALEQAGISPSAWKVAQRQYEVARRVEDLADAAILRKQATAPAGSLISSSTTLTGLLLKAGAEGLKAGKAVLVDWAPGALQRALESGAPRPIVQDLQKLSDLHAQQLEEGATAAKKAIAAASVVPEEAARREFLRTYGNILNAEQALKSTQLEPQELAVYQKSLSRARQMLEDAYYGEVPKLTRFVEQEAAARSGREPLIPRLMSSKFVDRAATALEQVERTLSPMSRLGPGRTLRHVDAADAVAGVRDGIRQSLANPAVFGQKYGAKAVKRMNESARVLVDPERVAALAALEEMTRGLQSQAATKVDRLMGVAGSTAMRLATTRDRDIRKRINETLNVISPRREPEEELVELEQEAQ